MGSFKLFGNPLGLFYDLGFGVYKLFDYPMTGFIKGPIEGSWGLMKGFAHLIKYSVSGTFNSIESITDTLGSGLCLASLVIHIKTM